MDPEDKTVTFQILGNEKYTLKPNPLELCRLCANTDNQLIPIFKGEGLEHDIPSKLEKHLPIIKVTETDKLPLQICYQCASTLIAWHNFYEGSSVADKRLREILDVDEKYQDAGTYEDFGEDFRDDDFDQSHIDLVESIPLSTTSTNSQHEELNQNESVSEITQLKNSKILNETASENTTDERSRKRGPLTTKSRAPFLAKEDHNEVVESKRKRSNTTPEASEIDTRKCSAIKKQKVTEYECSICTKTFLDPLIRNYHENAAHADDNWKPDTQILKLQPLHRIIRADCHVSVALEPVKCEDNDGEGIENIDVKISEEINDSYNCEHCDYRSKRKENLRRHITGMHMTKKSVESLLSNSLICAICEQTFENKTTLRRHVVRFHFKQAGRKSQNFWSSRYCCDVCGEGFQSTRKMLAHRNILHISAPNITWKMFRNCLRKVKHCFKCERFFARGKFLENHVCAKPDSTVAQSIENAVKAKPKYQCDLCSSCFLWKLDFRQHREDEHPDADTINWEIINSTDIKNYCNFCYVAFDDEAKIKDHKCVSSENDAQPKMLRCDICSSSYARKSDFYRHRRNKHMTTCVDNGESDSVLLRRKTYMNCPYCDQTFSTRNGILSHIKEVHNIDTDSPFVCVSCNKLFKRKATLDTHNQIYHPKEENTEETNKILKDAEILLNGELAYHCRMCNRNMHNSIRFIAHYRLHFAERKYTCDLCGKQTRTQHQLNSHIKFIHLNIRKFKCDICGKGFHAKQSCEEHRRIHTGERPFSCEICGKTFIAMNALFTHKKFHNDFYAHPCTLCDKKFKIRRSLINHIRTHTGERPFQCELCPKTFNNSSRFSYHKKVTHSDARPFTCKECGSCFKANKFLKRHMKLHKIRTQIQFRRRNNPAYFAAHESSNNSNKKVNQKISAKIFDEEYKIVQIGEAYESTQVIECVSSLSSLQKMKTESTDSGKQALVAKEAEVIDSKDGKSFAKNDSNPIKVFGNGRHITCL